ncbi:MAG: hypothetical protein IBJ09_14670 [Bacteroidia bacterium]|nr:hypothetical protein [Bacteroidia bacterium]
MAYTIKKTEMIDYAPEHLNSFEVSAYEWIDNLHFILNPQDCVENAEAYMAIARQRFLEEGWHGDGDIGLIWVPPFMIKEYRPGYTKGVIVWHVKQLEDGISWLLYPKEIFEENAEE